MFIDTSAIVAILLNEPDQGVFAKAIEASDRRYISALVRLEASMVITREFGNKGAECVAIVDRFLQCFRIEFVDITEDISTVAVEAFIRFGKGQSNPAQLNIADCMHYATAKHYRLPMLFKGGDFSKTDIVPVKLSTSQ